jgi:hypothetical protein
MATNWDLEKKVQEGCSGYTAPGKNYPQKSFYRHYHKVSLEIFESWTLEKTKGRSLSDQPQFLEKGLAHMAG